MTIVGGAVEVASGVSDQMMPDRCTISRPGEIGAHRGTDWVPADPTVIYGGKCRVQVAQAHPLRATQVEFGDEPIKQRMYIVAIPVTVTGVEVDDHVTVTESADVQLVGTDLVVTNIGRGSFAEGRYLLCNDPQEG